MDAIAADLEAALAVRALLRELPQARDRLMLKRFYLDDHDKDIICQEMNLSEAAFNQALSRARKRFRQIVEERGFAKRDLLEPGTVNQAHIDQYVAGRMGEAEACAFEDYCLANPEFARQVEFEQRLKEGLALVARGSRLNSYVRTSIRCAGTSPPQPESCSRYSRCTSCGT